MNKPFTTQLSVDTRKNLQRIAKACHMKDTQLAALILTEISLCAPERAKDILGIVPAEWKRKSQRLLPLT